jgi:hypothetical protein
MNTFFFWENTNRYSIHSSLQEDYIISINTKSLHIERKESKKHNEVLVYIKRDIGNNLNF